MKNLPSLTRETLAAYIAENKGKTFTIEINGRTGGYYCSGLRSHSVSGLKAEILQCYAPKKVSAMEVREESKWKTVRKLTISDCQFADLGALETMLRRLHHYHTGRIGHRVGLIKGEADMTGGRDLDKLRETLNCIFDTLPCVERGSYYDHSESILTTDYGWQRWHIVRASQEIETLCRNITAHTYAQYDRAFDPEDTLPTLALGPDMLPASLGLRAHERLTLIEVAGTFYGFVR